MMDRPQSAQPLHLATADQTLLTALWQISILLTMTLKHSPVTFLISFQSQALNEIWPFFSRFFGAELPLLFLRIKVKSLSHCEHD